jgi:hypothetical protein
MSHRRGYRAARQTNAARHCGVEDAADAGGDLLAVRGVARDLTEPITRQATVRGFDGVKLYGVRCARARAGACSAATGGERPPRGPVRIGESCAMGAVPPRRGGPRETA